MTDPLNETGRVSITAGMARAMAIHGAARQCPHCKLGIPKYPGRYPGKCPRCKESMSLEECVLPETVTLAPRAHNLSKLLAEAADIYRSEGPFFNDPSCSRFLLMPYPLIEEYGGVEGFKAWLEGPVSELQNDPLYYRVESMDDPVMCYTFMEGSECCRVFATEDPVRYLGFDPRAEMVNEDHDATFLAESSPLQSMTYGPGMAAQRSRMIDKTHDRVSGAFIEDMRASIKRARKPGEGHTQVRGGFRIHVGANSTRKPRKDVAKSLQNKINAKRGLRGRIQGAKKFHQSRKGQELHQALGRYNQSRNKSRAEAHDAALRGKIVDTLDRIKRYNSGQQRQVVEDASQIQQPTTEDHLEGIIRKLIVSNDLDVLQDVHFDERDGSIYLFFDPILMHDEIQEIVQAVKKERSDIELIASPDGSLQEEAVESLWWVLYAPGPMGGSPSPDVYAARPEDHYTKAQMFTNAPPSPPEAIAQDVNIDKLIKAAGDN